MRLPRTIIVSARWCWAWSKAMPSGCGRCPKRTVKKWLASHGQTRKHGPQEATGNVRHQEAPFAPHSIARHGRHNVASTAGLDDPRPDSAGEYGGPPDALYGLHLFSARRRDESVDSRKGGGGL